MITVKSADAASAAPTLPRLMQDIFTGNVLLITKRGPTAASGLVLHRERYNPPAGAAPMAFPPGPSAGPAREIGDTVTDIPNHYLVDYSKSLTLQNGG